MGSMYNLSIQCKVLFSTGRHTPYPLVKQEGLGWHRASSYTSLVFRSETYLTYKDLFSLGSQGPGPRACCCSSSVSQVMYLLDSKRLYSVRETRERTGNEWTWVLCTEPICQRPKGQEDPLASKAQSQQIIFASDKQSTSGKHRKNISLTPPEERMKEYTWKNSNLWKSLLILKKVTGKRCQSSHKSLEQTLRPKESRWERRLSPKVDCREQMALRRRVEVAERPEAIIWLLGKEDDLFSGDFFWEGRMECSKVKTNITPSMRSSSLSLNYFPLNNQGSVNNWTNITIKILLNPEVCWHLFKII